MFVNFISRVSQLFHMFLMKNTYIFFAKKPLSSEKFG